MMEVIHAIKVSPDVHPNASGLKTLRIPALLRIITKITQPGILLWVEIVDPWTWNNSEMRKAYALVQQQSMGEPWPSERTSRNYPCIKIACEELKYTVCFAWAQGNPNKNIGCQCFGRFWQQQQKELQVVKLATWLSGPQLRKEISMAFRSKSMVRNINDFQYCPSKGK